VCTASCSLLAVGFQVFLIELYELFTQVQYGKKYEAFSVLRQMAHVGYTSNRFLRG